jgi:hypothetical protein
MSPFNFLMELRQGLREMIEQETDPKATEFFSRVGKMAGVKTPVTPKPVIDGEVTNKEVEP